MTVQPRLLIVEDDDATREALVRILGQTYEVRAATDGVEALALLAQGFSPDVIVSDVMMPRLNGFDLAREIRKDPRLARVPLVFLTAVDSFAGIVTGINAGARHYITKPFGIPALLRKVSDALGKRPDLTAR